MLRLLSICLVVCVLATVAATVALAAPPGATNQKHDGWPEITGMLLINRNDLDRPLDARPGHDPFGGEDARGSRSPSAFWRAPGRRSGRGTGRASG